VVFICGAKILKLSKQLTKILLSLIGLLNYIAQPKSIQAWFKRNVLYVLYHWYKIKKAARIAEQPFIISFDIII
jgi:hypothetical protein